MRHYLLIAILPLLFLTSGASAQVPIWETMKYGLFVHFVYGEEYGLMTPMTPSGGEPEDINDFADSFDVEKFAEDVESMGFEYVIFTAWHANMNLLYPSEVMKKWRGPEHTSRRDLIADLYDALSSRGIELCLYSHIWVGNDFHPAGDGYYYYDNRTGMLTEDQKKTGYPQSVEGDSEIWDNFVNEVYDEMSSRYGDRIAAYWFDGTWTWNVDKTRIMNTIRRTNSHCAFIANGTPDHGLPYCSKEVGYPEGDNYSFEMDYPPVSASDVTTWPAYERHVAIIQGGNWWASTSGTPKFSPESVFLYTVLQAAANNNGGVSWSFSPFVNGEWEGDMLECMRKAYSYMEPVRESIMNTRASTSFVTEEGAKISSLKWGIVATMSPDGLYTYVHVLREPRDNRIFLPSAEDGKVFKSAWLQETGERLNMYRPQFGNVRYVIELPDDFEWNGLSTVVRLEL